MYVNQSQLWDFSLVSQIRKNLDLVQNKFTRQLMVRRISPAADYPVLQTLCRIKHRNLMEIYDVKKERSAYRNSKAGIVALVFAFICGGGCIGSFTSARNIYNVLYGTVLLIQTASFLLSFLERKEVIHLQKLLPFDGNKLPSLLMAVGFLLFIPALLLSTL